MLETLPTVQRTTVAGVPAWWAPADGPVTAALIFRTGRADETLANAGITHLVEHLALFPLGRRDYVYNGFVDQGRCVFYASGTLDEVRGFLRDVTAALGDLPLDRLEIERRLLRTEAAQREGGGLIPRLLSYRFGAAGYGLLIFEELGLRCLGAEAVSAWAAERFTRDNAVLWMTVEPPDDLELTLPPGRRFPAPAPRPLELTYPAAVAEGTGGIALTGLGPRTPALRVAAAAAAERLFERLRRDRGLTYSPFGSADPLDRETAHLVLAADRLDEHAATVRDELWRVANEVAEHGATEEEVARMHAGAVRGYEPPDAIRGELDDIAYEGLLGNEHLTAAESLERLAAVDGAASAAAMAAALKEPIFLVPQSAAAPPSFQWRATKEPGAVSGTRYQPPRSGALRRRPKSELVIGPDGVTWRGDGESMTVPWDECVSAERRLDGSIVFFRRDEGWLQLIPGSWENGEDALEEALEQLPVDRLLTEVEAELFERIMAAGAAGLPERMELSGELSALARELADGETPLTLVAALSGVSLGLLAVTDRRMLWLREAERKDWAWTSLIAVEAGTMGELRVIVRGEGTEKLTIQPCRRTKEIADWIARQIVAAE